MLLRFLVPGGIYLAGPSPESLGISATFTHEGYAARVAFPGGEVLELHELPEFSRFWKGVQGLQIGFSDEERITDVRPLAELLIAEKRNDLLQLMCRLASKVCCTIRNYAVVPAMPERLGATSVAAAGVEACLRKWSPETFTNAESWTALLDPKSIGFMDLFTPRLIRDMDIAESPELNVMHWPDVIEALEDNKEPPPELEFLTNAIGHLRQRNFRLAVVEAIICLEIVLTQFLFQYLTVSAGVPKNRLKKFLSPEIGLTARLSALLNLTLHESYLENVNLDKVIKAVEWRNEVIHKTGRLPTDIPEGILKDNISAVLSLARLLAERRDNVAASPELKRIAETLRSKGGMLWPQIWLAPSHRVRIDIEFFPGLASSDYRERLDALASEAAELLRRRDPRFDRSKHLTIHFKEVPGKSLGWFKAGSLMT